MYLSHNTKSYNPFLKSNHLHLHTWVFPSDISCVCTCIFCSTSLFPKTTQNKTITGDYSTCASENICFLQQYWALFVCQHMHTCSFTLRLHRLSIWLKSHLFENFLIRVFVICHYYEKWNWQHFTYVFACPCECIYRIVLYNRYFPTKGDVRFEMLVDKTKLISKESYGNSPFH